MLKGKQKRYLRSLSHNLQPIFQVGKGGVNENMIQQIKDALEARELIKISVLQNCELEVRPVAVALSEGTKAEIAQIIGHTIVLYKESVENKQIVFP